MEFIYEANRIYINDEEGKMIAEITNIIIIITASMISL